MNRSSLHPFCFLGFFAALLCLAGCGSGSKTFSVTGTVTYRGAPVAGADVMLSPVKEDPLQKPARGTTDANGKFSVQTYFSPDDDRSGATAGVFKFSLQKFPQSKEIVDPFKPGSMPKNELPEKYAAAKTTPFEFEVKSSGTNNFPLELVD